MTALVWFRNDLRLADNPALTYAVQQYDAVIPVFLWTPDEEGEAAPGAASRWYLHHSLTALRDDLDERTSRLIVRREATAREALEHLLDETGAESIFWNRRYAPTLRRRDAAIADWLHERGVETHAFEGRLLHDPPAVETTSGGPYHVYTPFRRKVWDRLAQEPPLPVPGLGSSHAPEAWLSSMKVNDLGLLPTVDWARGLRETWTPGEAAAHKQLAHFVEHDLIDYDDLRDRPDLNRTSRLSPRLHHGELSPRQVWHAVEDWVQNAAMREAADVFLQEVVWREFSYHVLYHYPDFPTSSLKDKFSDFDWHHDDEALQRWQQGQTGFPLVDAGMRQLWATGWMHNRVRMVVASFLTKDLLIYWQDGAAWFWDTLVDADVANNAMGWQWTAGSGPDAQPFFRIFNPISQSDRHDPDGSYIRRWVPELRDLPTRYLHAPWDAPDDVLREADVTLGETYPEPMVDHGSARKQALAAYDRVRNA